MRGIVCLCVVVSAAASACFGQARPILGHEIPYPPSRGTSEFIIDPAPEALPKSLNDMFSRSTLIVDASVQDVLPARVTRGRSLETDVRVKVNRVLKGVLPLRSVIICQDGGVIGAYREYTRQYDLMQGGERYILFLSDEERSALPAVPGGRRFEVTGLWTGIFKVLHDNTLDLPSATPTTFRTSYQQRSVDRLLHDIGTAVPGQ